MDIQLVSTAEDLILLCREVLGEVCDPQCTFSAVAAPDPSVPSDLYIWDCHPKLPLPEGIEESPSKHVLLVDRQDLERLRHEGWQSATAVLLKPPNRERLAALLRFAISARLVNSLKSERDLLLQYLIQANLKLQERDQDRTNFLARAVHDFGAPLTALNGYCGLLLTDDAGPVNENQREVLARMLSSARRLSSMAAGMYQLSQRHHPETPPKLQRNELSDCVNEALREVDQAAMEKHVSIYVDLSPCDEHLYFEHVQIEQVLFHLVDNACKFTPNNGFVEVRGYPFFWNRRAVRSGTRISSDRRGPLEDRPNSYRIDIRDSGTCIPPEHLERMFEENSRYAGSKDRSGGGLALAVCRMVVEQHEGLIWAENTVSGVMFCVVLPTFRPCQAELNQGPEVRLEVHQPPSVANQSTG